MADNSSDQKFFGLPCSVWIAIIFITIIFTWIDKCMCNDQNSELQQSDLEKFIGYWEASGKGYNPYSMGGVIEKGYYTTGYELEIKNNLTYKLYHGAIGHLRLKSEGTVELIEGNIIIKGMDVGNHVSHIVTQIEKKNDEIVSFCTKAITKDYGDDCSILFNKDY